MQASKYKAIWKENLVVNQLSLRVFFRAPLQLKSAHPGLNGGGMFLHKNLINMMIRCIFHKFLQKVGIHRTLGHFPG